MAFRQLTRKECRQQMHYAEHLVRQRITPPDHMFERIEAAYLSPTCEPAIAQRIQVALNTLSFL